MIALLKTALEKAAGPVVDAAKLAADLIPPGLRYGKPYRQALRLLRQSRTWSLELMRLYQQELLQRLVCHSCAHVPYYREIFRKNGLSSADIRTIKDLNKLPFLTKEIVRQRKNDLLAENVSVWQRIKCHTGGTTGSPMDFYVDKATHAMDRAMVFNHLEALGYRKGDKIAVLRGDSFSNPNRRYRYFPGSRQLVFSFRHIDDLALAEIVDTLTEFRPAFISAYPSVLQILCGWMERTKRDIPAPRCVLTSSETLSESLRSLIEKALKTRVVDWYGHSELTVAAAQYSCSRCYDVHGELGIMELIPLGHDQSEIVGTCLHNFAMPFLRYKTGDLAMKGNGCTICGKPHSTVSSIVGRQDDIIITPEKRLVPPSAIDFAFYHLNEIREGQIVQEDLRNLRLIVVPWDSLSDYTKSRLLNNIESNLQSPTMRLTLEIVDEIPRTHAGKRPIVVSRLKLGDFL